MQRLQIVLLASALITFPILADYGFTLAALKMLFSLLAFVAVLFGGIKLLIVCQRPVHNSSRPEL